MIRRSLRLISSIVLAFFMFSLCAPIVEAANHNRNQRGGNNRSNPSLQNQRRLQQQQLKAQLEATRRKALEAQRRQAEAKRRAQQEAQRKAKLAAQKKAQAEAQKRAQIEAQKKAQAKAEHQARMRAQQQAKAKADAIKKAQAQQAKIAANKARAQLLVKHPKANSVIDLNKIKAQSLAKMYDIDLGTAKKILAAKPSKGFKTVQDFLNVRDRVIQAAGPKTVNVRGPRGSVNINKPANLLIKDLARAGFSNADANAILQLRGRGTFKSFADLKAQLTRAGYKGPITGHKPPAQPKVQTKITKVNKATTPAKAPLKTSRGPAPSTPQGYYNAIKGAKTAPEVYQRLISKGVSESLAKEIAKSRIRLHRGFTSANDMAANVDSLKGTKAGQAGIKSAQLKQVRTEITKWNNQLEQISKIKPKSELGFNNKIKLLQEVRTKLAKQLLAEAKLKGSSNPAKTVSQDARYRKVVDRIQGIEKVKVVEVRKAQVAKEMHALNNRMSNMHKGNKPTTQQGLQTRIRNLNNVYGEMFGRVAEEMHLKGKKVTKEAVTNDPRLKKIQRELQSTRKAFTERRVADGKAADKARQAKELKQHKARAERMHKEALQKAKAEKARAEKIKADKARQNNQQKKGTQPKKVNNQRAQNQKNAPKASKTTQAPKKLSVNELYGKVKNSSGFQDAYKQLRRSGVEKNLAYEIAKARRAGKFNSPQDMAGRVKSLHNTKQGQRAIEQIKARSEKALSRANRYRQDMQKVKSNRPMMEHVKEGVGFGKPKVNKPQLKSLDAANKHYGQVRGRMQQLIKEIKAQNPGQFKNSRQVIKMARRSNLKTGRMAELRLLSDEYLRTKQIRTKLSRQAKLQPQTKSKASNTSQNRSRSRSNSNTQSKQTYNFKNFRSTNVKELSQANSRLTQQAMQKHGFKNAQQLKAALNKGGRLPQDLYQLKQVRSRISQLAKGSSQGGQQYAKANNKGPSAPKTSSKGSNTQASSDYSYKNFRSTNVRELSQANSRLTQQAMQKHGFKNAQQLKAALNKGGRLPQDLYQLKQVRGRLSQLAKGSSQGGPQHAKANNKGPSAPKTSTKGSNTRASSDYSFKNFRSTNVKELGRANSKLTQQAMQKHGFKNAQQLRAALNKGGRLPQDLYQLKQVRGRISQLAKGNNAPKAPNTSSKGSNTANNGGKGVLGYQVDGASAKRLAKANTDLTKQAMEMHGFKNARELKAALRKGNLSPELQNLKDVRARISEMSKASRAASKANNGGKGVKGFQVDGANSKSLARANTELTKQAMEMHGFKNGQELKAALKKGNLAPELQNLKDVRARISEMSKAPNTSTKASNTGGKGVQVDLKTTDIKELGRANTKLTKDVMKNHGFNNAKDLKAALKGSDLPKDLAQLKQVRSRISEVGKANGQNSGTSSKASNTGSGADAAPKKGGFFDFLFNKNAKGGPDILGKHGKVQGNSANGKHINNFIDMFDSKKMLDAKGAKNIDVSAKAKANADASWGKNLLENWKNYNTKAAKGWDIMNGHRAADAKAAAAKGAWWDVFGQNKVNPKSPSNSGSSSGSGSSNTAKAPGLDFTLDGEMSSKASSSFKPGKSVEAVTEQINQTKTQRADLFKQLKSSNPELTGKDIYQKSLSKNASGDFLKLRELDGKVHDLRAHRTNLKGMAKADASSAKAPTDTAKVDAKSTKPAASKSSGSIWENLFGKKGISQFFKGRGNSQSADASAANKGKAGTSSSSSNSSSSSSGKGGSGSGSGSSSSSSSQTKAPADVAKPTVEPLPNSGKIQSLDGRITQLRADSNALAKNMVKSGQYKSLYDVVKASRDPGATGDLARLNNMRTELKGLRTQRLGLAKDSTAQTNTKAHNQISKAVKSAQPKSTGSAVPADIAQAQAQVKNLQGQLKASAADAVAKGKFSSVDQALKSPEFRGKVAELNSMEKALNAKAAEASKTGPKMEGQVKKNHVSEAINKKGKGTESAKASNTKGDPNAKGSETSSKASQTADAPPALKVAEAKASQLRAQIQQLEAGKGGLLSRFTKGRQLSKAKAELAKVNQDIAKMKQDPTYLAKKNSELKIDPKSAQGKLIAAINKELAKPNLNPKYKAELMKRKASLESTPAQSFVKQGLQIVAISAATNILFNVYGQLKEDGKVDWGKATQFLTDKKFWMSTGGVAVGAWLGGKVAMMPFMYLLTSKVAAITPFGGLVMSLLPAFLGGALGGQLMGGGFQNIDWLMMIGQTLGSVLGTALAMTFFPGLGMIGNLAGAMIGGFLAQKLIEMIRGPKSEASGRGDGDTSSGGDVEPLPSTKGSGTFTDGDVTQAFANMKSSYAAYLEAEKSGNFGEAAKHYQTYIGYKRALDGFRQTSFSAAQ